MERGHIRVPKNLEEVQILNPNNPEQNLHAFKMVLAEHGETNCSCFGHGRCSASEAPCRRRQNRLLLFSSSGHCLLAGTMPAVSPRQEGLQSHHDMVLLCETSHDPRRRLKIDRSADSRRTPPRSDGPKQRVRARPSAGNAKQAESSPTRSASAARSQAEGRGRTNAKRSSVAWYPGIKIDQGCC